ncbi:diguanylate cyclase [Solirubrobacter phytolaccae]|uniref:Diguanylate cyclase n=1 Tax=Solirubrobacter phytolaccae TaxID=1404360 RepID=A0A9X3SA20_9ACTN|nr:diguanylate cyclase [Solirubrobacter phytolaccae]MDA0184024.1 diguanylate cyclase [Solirubrobacter phytolaccae]
MLRRLSPASVAVWFGVLVVLAGAILLGVELNRATVKSKHALEIAKVTGAYGQAHKARDRQDVALNAGDAAAWTAATQAVHAGLAGAVALDASERPQVDRLLRMLAAYEASVADGRLIEARSWSRQLETAILGASDAAGVRAHRIGISAYASERRVVDVGRVEVGLAFVVFGALWWMLRQHRRRLDAAQRQEIERLSEMASSDPLTALRNHRLFHEDLARELQRSGRTGIPLALVLLDLDNLKTLNDTHGHQAGDRCLQALAHALRDSLRATDTAYRIGGDEFAVILPDARAWGALEFVQRLHHRFSGVTAGIAAAESLTSRDALVHDADMALLTAKRSHQRVLVYTDDMDPGATAPTVDDHHTQMLAAALARAVDAKDAYTRSHCNTVSQLSALVATELGFTGDRLAKIRLAGLLHDVGKIGVPDAILNKPAGLTDDEYELMKQHAQLGFEIVDAAGLPEQARWVRHHHERIDGRGYPDGLSGDEIPLESRIILVADSYEAMTSDRPYRRAPGREFALDELARHAGSQFDPDVVEALTRVLDQAGVRVMSSRSGDR